MISIAFEFKAEHCTRAAIEELKEYFRKTKYSKCYKQHKEEIDYLVAHSHVSLKRLNYILRETSDFAGLYDVANNL